MLRSRVAVSLVIALAACTSKPAPSDSQPQAAPTNAEPTPPATEATPATEPEAKPSESTPTEPKPTEPPPSETPPPAATPVRFWVAHSGMRAYDLDGHELATIPIDATEIRRLADGRLLGFSPQAKHSKLLLLDATGKQLLDVALPVDFDEETCAVILAHTPAKPAEGESGEDDDDWFEPLSPQMASAVAIDAAGGHACLSLQDRNDNMADKGMLIAVDLRTGALRQRITLDVLDVCQDKGDLEPPPCKDSDAGQPWIEGTPAPVPPTAWTYVYDQAKHTLSKPGGQPALLCAAGADPTDSWGACTEIESTSPSGRWVLLSGRVSEGDYIHRDLLLLDLADGKLWRVHEHDEGPRFVAIKPADIFTDVDVPVMSAVGESDVGWLPNDRLWLDGRLLIPESKTIVRIGGTRVRTL